MAREETVSWRLTALSPRSDGQPSPDMDRHGTHGMDRDLSFTIGKPSDWHHVLPALGEAACVVGPQVAGVTLLDWHDAVSPRASFCSDRRDNRLIGSARSRQQCLTRSPSAAAIGTSLQV
jgi:hypothetical protein